MEAKNNRKPRICPIDKTFKIMLSLFVGIPVLLYMFALISVLGPLVLLICGFPVIILPIVVFCQGCFSLSKLRSGTGDLVDKSYAIPAIVTPCIYLILILAISVVIAIFSLLRTDIDLSQQPLYFMLGLLWIIIGLVFTRIAYGFRKQFVSHGFLITAISLISLVTGAWFGGSAEYFYHMNFFYNTTEPCLGWRFGAISGLLTGICYALVLSSYHDRNPRCSTVGFATVIGVITGMICSTLVHLSMAIVHGLLFLLINGSIGLVFGIYAGTAVGWICSAFIRPVKPEPVIADPTQPELIQEEDIDNNG